MGVITNRFAGVFIIALAIGVPFGFEPANAHDVEPATDAMTVQDGMSVHAELERLAAELKAHSNRAIDAAAQVAQQAVEDNAETLADVQAEWSEQLETFRTLLNDQKANLDRMAEDAAASLDTWTKAAKDSWLEMHDSAQDALDRLQDWLDRQSASPEAIPV